MAGMASPRIRLLQAAVAIAGIVPVAAGLAGVILGPDMAGSLPHTLAGQLSLDSHFRYLSGLLLGIGLAFWSLIPAIATSGRTFRLLTAIVFTGGVGRLLGVGLAGLPPAPMRYALIMELVVTPLLCLWQWRVETQARAMAAPPGWPAPNRPRSRSAAPADAGRGPPG